MLRECIRRLNRGYRAVDPGVLRRWWITLAAGMAVVFALALAMVAAGAQLEASGALAWEGRALRAVGYSKMFGTGMRLTRRLAFHAEATAK